MQKISFGDREYVRASEVAKRFKYTQDYVGQLCRGDKVDARLVGRVWYVNLDSVTEYRKTKHATQKKAAKSNATPSDSRTKKRKVSKVEPVVRAKTARKLQERFPKEAKLAVQHIKPKYSRDKAATIPVVLSSEKRSTVSAPPEQKQPSRKVVIKVRPNTKKSTKYHAEKRPEITLKSKLKVTDRFENLVPETIAESEQQSPREIARKPEMEVNLSERSRPSATTISFQPKSVALDVSKRESRRGTSGNRYKLVWWLVFLLITTAVVLFVLGLSYANETGSPTATSGLEFSLEKAFKKLQEVGR